MCISHVCSTVTVQLNIFHFVVVVKKCACMCLCCGGLHVQRKWNLVPESPDGMFYFHREQKADESIPSLDLATRAIEYAHELEMII